MASSQVIWHIVRDNNSYLRKNLNNTWFSTEKGNLAGRHSYKYSGLANQKTAGVKSVISEEVKGVQVDLRGKQGKFRSFVTTKGGERAVRAVAKEVGNIRPDLVKSAKAAASSAAAAARRAQAPE